MSEWVDIPLAVAMGEDDSTYISDVEMTNLMFKENPPGSRKPFHITSVPTLADCASIDEPTTAAIRGVCILPDSGGFVYVIGTDVYVGAVPMAGSMPGTAPCRMVATDTYIVIVDGTNARALKLSDLTIYTPSMEGFIDVTYQDGYTIFVKSVTNKLYVSDLDDPLTIGALNFTTVDALAGDAIGVVSVNREVYVFKSTSIQHYHNAGGAGFPFQRSSPGLIETGCWTTGATLTDYLRGVNTIQELNGVVYFLGSDLRVYAMRGNQASPVSAPWVDAYLRTNVSSETLYGSVYVLHGRSYYVLSGITEGSTEMAVVYDIDNRLWHKRYSSIASTIQITHAAQALGSVPVVAAKNTTTGFSKFYEYDLDGTNDVGASGQVNRVITLPQLNYGGTRAFMPELLLDMEKPATTGTITLTWSDNGGSSYTTGVTNTGANPRTRWQRLGSFYQRILRLTFSIASKISIMGVRARIEVGE